MSDRHSFSAVIRAFPSQAALAAEMGERAGTVSAWAQRDRIPSNRWVALVSAARRLGVAGVDYELLARIDARGRRAGEPASGGSGPVGGGAVGGGAVGGGAGGAQPLDGSGEAA